MGKMDECAAFSIDEFCRAHRVSRATLYNLWKAGRGPRFIKLAQRRLISVEAAAAWRREMESESAAAETAAAAASVTKAAAALDGGAA